MKENSGIINQVLFGQFCGEGTGRIFDGQLRQTLGYLLRLVQRIFPAALATVIMGIVYFICISLFLYQIAEHG
jgi:hypothetical protein